MYSCSESDAALAAFQVDTDMDLLRQDMLELQFAQDQHYLIGNFIRKRDSDARRSLPDEQYVTS